jgi:hypothetical protein
LQRDRREKGRQNHPIQNPFPIPTPFLACHGAPPSHLNRVRRRSVPGGFNSQTPLFVSSGKDMPLSAPLPAPRSPPA